MSNIGFLPFSQPPAGGLGANSRGRRNFQDSQLNTLTVSDKTILNCLAINTDKLKCIDVLEMTGTAVFGGNVIFNGPVAFSGAITGALNLCNIACSANFLLTAQGSVIIDAPNSFAAINAGASSSFIIEGEDDVDPVVLSLLNTNGGMNDSQINVHSYKDSSGGGETVLNLRSEQTNTATGGEALLNIITNHTGGDASDNSTIRITSHSASGLATINLSSDDTIIANAGGTLTLHSENSSGSVANVTIQADHNGGAIGDNAVISLESSVSAGAGTASIKLESDNEISLNASSSATTAIFNSGGIGLSANSGGIGLAASGTYFLTGAADSTVGVTGAGTNLTVSCAGAGTSQLLLSSAGTGAASLASSAVQLSTVTGGIGLNSAVGYFITGAADSTVQTTGTADILITGAADVLLTSGNDITLTPDATGGTIQIGGAGGPTGNLLGFFGGGASTQASDPGAGVTAAQLRVILQSYGLIA
jgi:hypothetical protein